MDAIMYWPIILSAEQVSEMNSMRDVTGKQVIYRSLPSKVRPGFHDILIGTGDNEYDADGVWLEADGGYNYG